MTRAQIRTLLRRHIQDVPAVSWTDVELDAIINLAYSLVQKEIRKIDPEAHLFWDYMNTVAGTSWYPLPATFSVSQVGIKGASTDLVHTRLDPKRYQDIVVLTAASHQYYALRGQWIGIFPAPTVSVTNGLELVSNPIMALADDAEVPRIKDPLHLAIVYWARLIALGDTDEKGDETRIRLNEMLGDLPFWYNLNADDNMKLQPSL